MNVNQAMDLVMRRFVGARMRPQIAYSATDTALIVVAPQRDLLVGGVSNLTQLVNTARTAGIRVIFAPMAAPGSAATGLPPGRQVLADAGLLRVGSPGADIPPDLGPIDGDIVLPPFDGLSAFTEPTLSFTLAQAGLDRVLVAGARTDIEIDSTARDAIEAGLHTTVVSDCCTGSHPDAHRATIDITLPRLVHAVLPVAELARYIR